MWGKLISDLQREKGLSQRQLAKLSGVDRQSLRHILSGTSPGRLDQLEALLAVFGYELEAVRIEGERR